MRRFVYVWFVFCLLADFVASADGITIQKTTRRPKSKVSAANHTNTAPSPNTAIPQTTGPVNLTTNLFVGDDNLPSRYILPDRGVPIPYLIDADHLPAGISASQAIGAVQSALAAWSAVTSVKFGFLGVQSFGQAASNFNNGDGILRIQLHDFYGSISAANASGDVLGVGLSYRITDEVGNWTRGGNVNGSDFHESVNGYIELAYTNALMTNLSLFTEVICHEIGHTLGLAHSSNNSNETNAYLKNAIMYFTAHDDGRGATLGAYDGVVARQAHPITNTPPYMYDRYLHIVTGPGPLVASNANIIQLRGYDLQTTNLTVATNEQSDLSSIFDLKGDQLDYSLPYGDYEDTSSDPASGDVFDLIYVRCSDGTNASPFAAVSVIGFANDGYSEGIPNAWRQTYFGNVNPSVGVKHHSTDDADGDGYNNVTEYVLGSDPSSKASNLVITNATSTSVQWQAKPYEVYEILGTTNFITWTRAGNPVMPTTTNGFAAISSTSGPGKFYRVEKVP